MQIFRAIDRLNGLAPDREGASVLFHRDVTYTCAACSQKTAFDINAKCKNPQRLNLFDQAMGAIAAYEEDYCDFDCQTCGAHVRCVYALAEVSMAHYEYTPHTIYHLPPMTGFEMKRPPVKTRSIKRWLLLAIIAVTTILFLQHILRMI